MFHECLFISPDLDGHRAPNRALTLRDPENCKVSKPEYEATALLCSHRSIGYPNPTICFTICLFISPDLDGQGTKKEHATAQGIESWNFTVHHDMFHDMFTTCPSPLVNKSQHLVPAFFCPGENSCGWLGVSRGWRAAKWIDFCLEHK